MPRQALASSVVLLALIVPTAAQANENLVAFNREKTPATFDPFSLRNPKMPMRSKKSEHQLQGKAEVTELGSGNSAADGLFKKGIETMRKTEFSNAAQLFKRAGAMYGRGKGNEKLAAEAKYYEAGCRMMMGDNIKAALLYRRAWALFQRHDPLNPLVGKAVEQLCTLTISRHKLEKKIKLLKMSPILVDREIVLTGSASSNALKGMIKMDKIAVGDAVHTCFTQMTCLETAELGSNSTNANFRWEPLLVSGQTAAFALTGDGTYPTIRLKINGRYYTVKIDLPKPVSAMRNLLLITNREKVCAIDTGTSEIWVLDMKRHKDGSVTSFHWRKLTHIKDGRGL